jgi:hypothetical protein
MTVLTISTLIGSEVWDRELSVYGGAFLKIEEAYAKRIKRVPMKIQFTADEVADLREECLSVEQMDWDSGLKAPYRALLRQIEKVVEVAHEQERKRK